ncbi:hypothetical protein AMATHDRAFT_147005 [Amanita thiersii Skay4041]|uniref:PBP domain-containing protein n=1 Tax=Amanita thiersii Skay4041 TaxID=703135 RepID=A0A2A9NN84_9AGAR|nr:hypothetical protein AMATHDRAFT_147005 [Amanita thiersii Skay4041]
MQTVSRTDAIPVPDGLYLDSGICVSNAYLRYQERYNGGYDVTSGRSLRIATGGSGQSGLIRAWANEFIKFCVTNGVDEPFFVDWYLGDTTESLGLLQDGSVDVALTYNDAAERQALRNSSAVRRVYGFRDHFYLVGPTSDPAQTGKTTNVLDAFNRIVSSGNRDALIPPDVREPTRFLSRFDKSATNIKESQLFITIGQVPWALTYSKWYHQYPRFPLQALEAAASLKEYTLTDRGTWLSSKYHVRSELRIYQRGDQNDPGGWLLNPARVLMGAKAKEKKLATYFLDWVIAPNGGQKVIREFKKNGEVLYAPAPENELELTNL